MELYIGEIVYEDWSERVLNGHIISKWVAEGIYCCRERIELKILPSNNFSLSFEAVNEIGLCIVDYIKEVKNVSLDVQHIHPFIRVLYGKYDEGIWCSYKGDKFDPYRFSYLGKGKWATTKPRRSALPLISWSQDIIYISDKNYKESKKSRKNNMGWGGF